MPWADKVAGLAGGIEDGQDRGRPLLRRNARSSAEMIDGNREIRAERGGIILHHGVEIESPADLRQQRHTELPPAIEHEIVAGASHGELVFLGKLVDAQNGDDVLQILVALQNPLHPLGHVVVILADDARARGCARSRPADRRRDRCPTPTAARLSTVVASRWAKVVAGAGSVKSSAGT